MADGESGESRRRVLRATGCGSAIVLAGCVSVGEDTSQEAGEPALDRPADWCFDRLDDAVPEAEANAVSIDGIERKPEGELASKEEASYQCGPADGNHCGTCTYYIDDRDGDAVGACTEVAGEIRSADWCALWAPREELQNE
ncbi:high-potential iron-sulfur protein [Haloterrigena sp. SYSU A558-1]|uniref:High-potential iron-sulfur protein n=1 Tax=Haloterrigena gelatinilytica TaxID=2741724 RepID=A0ABX2LA69_9EURY|nr:high-potential iron-sulfur protein [Haloterrigena gelatinilytica]NUC71783.1 high-potential iron-sulfur protein [Haloterrigena gelatinilytica]